MKVFEDEKEGYEFQFLTCEFETPMRYLEKCQRQENIKYECKCNFWAGDEEWELLAYK